MEDLQTSRKPAPQKGEKPPPPPTPGAKRKTHGDATPAPKKRKIGGPARPTAYPDVQDLEDDIDTSKPIAERLRNSPKLSPSKPPTKLGKGKGKGNGRGKGQGEKPAAARSLDQEPADERASGSSDLETSGNDNVDPDADTTGGDEEADDNDEIQEE